MNIIPSRKKIDLTIRDKKGNERTYLVEFEWGEEEFPRYEVRSQLEIAVERELAEKNIDDLSTIEIEEITVLDKISYAIFKKRVNGTEVDILVDPINVKLKFRKIT